MNTLILIFVALFATDSKVEQYIEQHYKFAQYTDIQYDIPASITLAQAIVESASGTSNIALKANNHFGIRYFPNTYYKGPHWNGWRVYQTVRESYIDHALWFKYTVTTCKWPYGKDYKVWANYLQACKYAGDSQIYADELVRVVEQYNLTQYDVH